MHSTKILTPIVAELFIRGRKLNISIFITQSYLAVSKNIILKNTILLWKFQKTRISKNCFQSFSDIDFQDFMNLYKKCNAKPYSFLVTDTTLSSDNPLRLR